METRAFNSIFVDINRGELTKTSKNIIKLKDEIDYYLKLPDNIINLFPKLLDYKKDYTAYTIEYIPYKSLSKLISDNKISLTEVKYVLEKLFSILEKIHSIELIKPNLMINNKNFLIQKTIDRVALLENNPLFGYLINKTLIINNKIYKNFKYYQRQFTQVLEEFFEQNPTNTVIHGDFSFSNILYCPSSKDIKLIDPRGSFGCEGIYGHPYYDYAKLMHCINGNYDDIVSGNFKLIEHSPINYNIHIDTSPLLKELCVYFKNSMYQRKINTNILHLIESSLFLSMTALHYEDSQRQKVLFLTGIILMNNFFEQNYENMY